MRNCRIFVDIPLKIGADVALSDQAATHVARVLRLRPDDEIELFNGDGNDYRARLTAAGPRGVTARVESGQPGNGESPLRITLAQGLARGDKMDWVVRKATELGVAAIVPLATERSEVKLDARRADKRAAHWRAVAAAACEQSGRCVVPAIGEPQPLDRWLAGSGAALPRSRWMLHPGSDARPRRMQPAGELLLVVGPEGGLGERDLETLRAAGFSGLSLGPRVLRTETAGLAALAALQALHGDL